MGKRTRHIILLLLVSSLATVSLSSKNSKRLGFTKDLLTANKLIIPISRYTTRFHTEAVCKDKTLVLKLNTGTELLKFK